MSRNDLTADEGLDLEVASRGIPFSVDVVPDPILKGAIDRLPVRHRLNLLFILWPPLVAMLNAMVRGACTAHAADKVEVAMAKALLSGLRAADNVKDYAAPLWPLRVVDAFGVETAKLISPLLDDPFAYVPIAGQTPGARTRSQIVDDRLSARPVLIR